MIEPSSSFDQFSREVDIEDARLETAEEFALPLAFVSCGWAGCLLGNYWWLLAGIPLYFLIRYPYLKRQTAADEKLTASVKGSED